MNVDRIKELIRQAGQLLIRRTPVGASVMPSDVAAAVAAMTADERATFIAGMAQRIQMRTGLPIELIIAIITQLLPLIMNGCNKPANVTDARALLAFAAKNHPNDCPIFYRSAFRNNGVQRIDHKDDINDLWAIIIGDANRHAGDASRAIMAA